MGFMKFMKKDISNQEDLDIPPPPPIDAMGSGSDDMSFPPFQPGKLDLNSLPPLPGEQSAEGMNGGVKGQSSIPQLPKNDDIFSSESQSSQGFDILPIRAPEGMNEPDFGEPDISSPFKESSIPPIRSISPRMPKMRHFEELLKQPLSDVHEVEPLKMERRYNPSSVPGKQLFIEVGKYKVLLKDLNNLRKSLKESDEEVSELIGDINEEEKIFSDLHKNLSEVEKKLVELEQGLFS